MSEPLHILILAAGLGTRLKPLTDQMPKPLVPVVDLSILEHQLRLIAELKKHVEVASVCVNAHHLYEQIVEKAAHLRIDQVFVEQPKILGTGGPLYRMWEEDLRGELLVMNSDNFHHFDLAAFVKSARDSKDQCALLCVDCPEINSLDVDVSGRVCGVRGVYRAGNPIRNYTFSGVSWYNSEAWSRILAEDFSIVDYWKRESTQGRYPHAYAGQSSALWIDMGTPNGYFKACAARLLELALDRYHHPGSQVDIESIGPGSVICEGAVVEEKSEVIGSIILPGARVKSGERIQDAILGDGFKWILNQN